MSRYNRLIDTARLSIACFLFFGLVCPISGEAEELMTAAGAAEFEDGATILGIDVHELLFGSAVVLDGVHEVAGHFTMTLESTPPADDTDIEVEIRQATIDVNNTVTLLGAATATRGPVNFGTGVPFAATVTAESLQITLDGQQLPAVKLAPGDVSID